MTQKMMCQNFKVSINPQPVQLTTEKDTSKITQKFDQVLRNLRYKIEGEPYDETEFTHNYQYKHYLQNIIRIEIRQDVLTKRYYNDTGMISHYQILLPKQLLDEFLHALRRQVGASHEIC